MACRRREVTEIGTQSWLHFWSSTFFVKFLKFWFASFVEICFSEDIWRDLVRFGSSRLNWEVAEGSEIVCVISEMSSWTLPSLILWMEEALQL